MRCAWTSATLFVLFVGVAGGSIFESFDQCKRWTQPKDIRVIALELSALAYGSPTDPCISKRAERYGQMRVVAVAVRNSMVQRDKDSTRSSSVMTVFVAFVGTSNLNDWATNANIGLQPLSEQGQCSKVPCVHKGFRDAYEELKSFVAGVFTEMRRDKRFDIASMVCTGHSQASCLVCYNAELTMRARQGAAIAALAAQHLRSAVSAGAKIVPEGVDVQHIGFACPCTGNDVFYDQMAQQGINTLCVIHQLGGTMANTCNQSITKLCADPIRMTHRLPGYVAPRGLLLLLSSSPLVTGISAVYKQMTQTYGSLGDAKLSRVFWNSFLSIALDPHTLEAYRPALLAALGMPVEKGVEEYTDVVQQALDQLEMTPEMEHTEYGLAERVISAELQLSPGYRQWMETKFAEYEHRVIKRARVLHERTQKHIDELIDLMRKIRACKEAKSIPNKPAEKIAYWRMKCGEIVEALSCSYATARTTIRRDTLIGAIEQYMEIYIWELDVPNNTLLDRTQLLLTTAGAAIGKLVLEHGRPLPSNIQTLVDKFSGLIHLNSSDTALTIPHFFDGFEQGNTFGSSSSTVARTMLLDIASNPNKQDLRLKFYLSVCQLHNNDGQLSCGAGVDDKNWDRIHCNSFWSTDSKSKHITQEVKRFVESYDKRPDSSVIKVIQNALPSKGDDIDIRGIIYGVYKANVPLRSFGLTNLYELFAFNEDQCSATNDEIDGIVVGLENDFQSNFEASSVLAGIVVGQQFRDDKTWTDARLLSAVARSRSCIGSFPTGTSDSSQVSAEVVLFCYRFIRHVVELQWTRNVIEGLLEQLVVASTHLLDAMPTDDILLAEACSTINAIHRHSTSVHALLIDPGESLNFTTKLQKAYSEKQRIPADCQLSAAHLALANLALSFPSAGPSNDLSRADLSLSFALSQLKYGSNERFTTRAKDGLETLDRLLNTTFSSCTSECNHKAQIRRVVNYVQAPVKINNDSYDVYCNTPDVTKRGICHSLNMMAEWVLAGGVISGFATVFAPTFVVTVGVPAVMVGAAAYGMTWLGSMLGYWWMVEPAGKDVKLQAAHNIPLQNLESFSVLAKSVLSDDQFQSLWPVGCLKSWLNTNASCIRKTLGTWGDQILTWSDAISIWVKSPDVRSYFTAVAALIDLQFLREEVVLIGIVGPTKVGKTTITAKMGAPAHPTILENTLRPTMYITDPAHATNVTGIVDFPGLDDVSSSIRQCSEHILPLLSGAILVTTMHEARTQGTASTVESLRKHGVPFVVLLNQADKQVIASRNLSEDGYRKRMLEDFAEKCRLLDSNLTPLVNCFLSSMSESANSRDVLVYNESLPQLVFAYSTYRLLGRSMMRENYTLDDAITSTQRGFSEWNIADIIAHCSDTS